MQENPNIRQVLYAHSGEPADIERLIAPIEDYVPVTGKEREFP